MAGQVVLVTGATSGIGLATARLFIDAGDRVVALARNQAVLEELEAAWGDDRLFAIAADLRDPEQLALAFDAVAERWGGVDVLINNAGLGHDAPLLTGDDELWREILEVNVLGLAICTRLAVAQMRARGDAGTVVHVSSMSGHRVPGGGAMYAASKHAVRALTEGLRKELRAAGSGVRVCCVSPGGVETDFQVRQHGAERAAEIYGSHTQLQPDDVAEVVHFLVTRPAHVEIHDVLLRPTPQPE
jgi:NADP-dependent 3-hydroxy acid dehydrogenase YdfG